MDTREDTRKAYHEAGHTVAFWQAGWNPMEASIDPGREGEARAKASPFVFQTHENARYERDDAAMIARAGMVAESIWKGEDKITAGQKEHHSTDWHWAMEYAKQGCPDSHDYDTHLAGLEERTREFLERRRPILDRLAEELLCKRTLDDVALFDFHERHWKG